MINLTKLVRKAFQRFDQRDSTGEALQDSDIVLTNVKLKVVPDSVTWTDTTQTDNPCHPRTVNITKSNTASSEAFGQVQTIKEDNHFVRVTLENGIVQGVNRPLKLPLKKKEEELIKAFGPYVEINPSKAVSEPVLNKTKIGVAVEGALGAQGATAQITNTEKKYKAQFRGTVHMYGKALASGLERPIGDIIKALQDNEPENTDLKDLTVIHLNEENVVQFTIEGNLECKWDGKHTVEWK